MEDNCYILGCEIVFTFTSFLFICVIVLNCALVIVLNLSAANVVVTVVKIILRRRVSSLVSFTCHSQLIEYLCQASDFYRLDILCHDFFFAGFLSLFEILWSICLSHYWGFLHCACSIHCIIGLLTLVQVGCSISIFTFIHFCLIYNLFLFLFLNFQSFLLIDRLGGCAVDSVIFLFYRYFLLNPL